MQERRQSSLNPAQQRRCPPVVLLRPSLRDCEELGVMVQPWSLLWPRGSGTMAEAGRGRGTDLPSWSCPRACGLAVLRLRGQARVGLAGLCRVPCPAGSLATSPCRRQSHWAGVNQHSFMFPSVN